MSCSAYITDLAQSIYLDLDSPSNLSVAAIQSKLVSSAFLGQLNSLVGQCHAIATGDISPVLDTDEQGIYAKMYESDFWTRKIAAIANGTDINWVSLRDGDSSIVRASPVDQMRLYRDMQKQLNDELRILSNAYRADGATTRDVAFYNVVNGLGYGLPDGFVGNPGGG